MKTHKRYGFTLIEVMIVLAILVLLITMVGPRLLKQQDKADQQLTVQQIDNVEGALKFYKIDNRMYPTTEEGLSALVSKPADENRSRNWGGPYLDEMPVDTWGNPIRYEFPPKIGVPDKPNVWSVGPDGKENTDDDVWKKKPQQESQQGGKTDVARKNNNNEQKK